MYLKLKCFAGSNVTGPFIERTRGLILEPNGEQQTRAKKMVLRPLIGLMRDQSPDEIERHCVEEMNRYHRLRDDAVVLEALLASPGMSAAGEGGRAYVSAMIAVHAQQTVVSTLIDILGYVPATALATPH
jgi:TraR antiactivator